MTSGAHLAQQAVLEAVTESSTLEHGAGGLLAAVGQSMGWQHGALWLVDDTGELSCAGEWSLQTPALRRFGDRSKELTFKPGEGLPGRVMNQKKPVWLADAAGSTGFLRAAAAEDAGLQVAVGVPVCGRSGAIGVMEFLADEIQTPEAELVAALEAIGSQAGLAIEGWWAEERRRRSDAVRSAVLSAALDCVAIMDARGRIVEFNPAAERIFGYERDRVVGQELAELIVPPELQNAHREGLERYLRTGQSKILNHRLEMTARRANGELFPVELTVTALPDQDPPLFAGFVRDLTELREAAAEQARLIEQERSARLDAEAAEERYREIAQTLQTSLLPPRLPVVPGYEVAARFYAAGAGVSVGGDFYDVHETRSGWHAVIGDVCGKGATAAAVTALTRHTVRAASLSESSPSRILRTLNEALRPPEAEELKLCSAAYLTLGSSGAVCVGVGGHPLPIVVRASGSVERFGTPGTVLGADDDPILTDWEGSLEPGDLLLLYTDGLTDARRDGTRLGEDALEPMIRGADRSNAEGLVDSLASRIFDDLGYRAVDDVALLAFMKQ